MQRIWLPRVCELKSVQTPDLFDGIVMVEGDAEAVDRIEFCTLCRHRVPNMMALPT